MTKAGELTTTPPAFQDNEQQVCEVQCGWQMQGPLRVGLQSLTWQKDKRNLVLCTLHRVGSESTERTVSLGLQGSGQIQREQVTATFGFAFFTLESPNKLHKMILSPNYCHAQIKGTNYPEQPVKMKPGALLP